MNVMFARSQPVVPEYWRVGADQGEWPPSSVAVFRLLYRFLTSLARLAVRSGRSKDLEIIVLRHQLTVVRRQVDRPPVNDDDRTLLGAIAAALPRPLREGWIVTPETLLRWHRKHIARHWTQTTRRPARPATDVELRQLIVRLATENPTGAWTTQAARNLFVAHTEHLESAPGQVHDRGSHFIDTFDEILRTEGHKILPMPARTPVANTFAERWIGSIRHELLDRTIVWNQRRLERIVRDYVAHHNEHRPHRSLQQRTPTPTNHPPPGPPATVSALRTTRCGGLINEYQNAA